jgi:hypothetical protein
MTASTETHAARLHARYVNLTFKSDPSDTQDARREVLFQRLVLHHLLNDSILTRADWLDARKSQKSTFDFLQNYAKALWPGSVASRSHLDRPNLDRKTRSFVGDVDGHWSGKEYGSKAKQRVKFGGYDLETAEGMRSLSKIGKLFTKYVGVLLENGLTGAKVEDTGALVAEILRV